MSPHLKEQLAEQKITFQFNPPSAPHFGGTWEREVKSVKTTLKVILKEQTVSETVLMGHHDSSLPQTVYDSSDLLGKRPGYG